MNTNKKILQSLEDSWIDNFYHRTSKGDLATIRISLHSIITTCNKFNLTLDQLCSILDNEEDLI